MTSAAIMSWESSVRPTRRGGRMTHGHTMPVMGAFEFTAPPIINAPGQVVFRGHLDDKRVGIFVSNGRKTVPIVMFEGNFGYFGDGYSINDLGEVLFTATFGGSPAIFTGDGSSTKTVADTNGPYSFFPVDDPAGVGPAINNMGTVAFGAILRDGRKGIFTGPDPTRDKVIVTGDPLFGSTVSFLEFCRQGLNDSGQIAFYARLSDGTAGFYRADPQGKRGQP